jgi:uncharacterized protein YndB with AHSA1/START domain
MAQALRKHEARTLVLEREFSASPERVFHALTRAEDIAAWFGPGDDIEIRNLAVDLRPGGSYRLEMHYPDGSHYELTGTYVEIQPPTRLVMTWTWLNSDYAGIETLVTFELTSSDKGTHLQLTHENLDGIEARDAHEGGWSGSFERLERLLAG